MLGLVSQSDVTAAVLAALRAAAADQAVFTEVLKWHLQVAKLAFLKTLHTVISLGDSTKQAEADKVLRCF